MSRTFDQIRDAHPMPWRRVYAMQSHPLLKHQEIQVYDAKNQVVPLLDLLTFTEGITQRIAAGRPAQPAPQPTQPPA